MPSLPGCVTSTALLLSPVGLFLARTTPALSQSPPTLHYDVVSVREGRTAPDGSITLSSDPDDPHVPRFGVTNWDLKNLLSAAFPDVPSEHIQGIPALFARSYYVVQARSDEDTAAVLRTMSEADAEAAKTRMLQEVLSIRFHLRYHVEMREAPDFQLIRTQKPPRLKKYSSAVGAKEDEAGTKASDTTQPAISERCDSKGCTLSARGQTLQTLASFMSGQVGGPITDATHLSGLWSYDLAWNPSGLDLQGNEAYPPPEKALEEQLGLKLVRGKSMQPFLIVDHAEAPTPN